MSQTTFTPPRQADAPAAARTLTALQDEAELHMRVALRVPAELLPSALPEHSALALISTSLRGAVLRRSRLADRLKVAASQLAGEAINLISEAGQGVTPDRGEPIHPGDTARVTELTARLREIDHRLTQEVATLIAVAQSLKIPAGLPEDALPDAGERALQRGVGPAQ